MPMTILELTEEMRMAKPRNELEVTLREFGCPYPPGPLANAWLSGYRKGYAEGSKMAQDLYNEAIDKLKDEL